jgi:hypothetical protein
LRQQPVQNQVAEVRFAPTHDDQQFVHIRNGRLRQQVFALFHGFNGDFVGRDEAHLHPIASINAFALLEQLAAWDAQDDTLLVGQPHFNAHSAAGNDEPSHPIKPSPFRKVCGKVFAAQLKATSDAKNVLHLA